MARTVALGSGSGPSGDVTVWWTNSFVMGAYFWLFLRIDSSAPHSARVMTGGSATVGFVFTVVVVVLALVVDDEDEDDEDEDGRASALRSPPPSGGGVSAAAPAGAPVATRLVRGPCTVSMARISTLRASPAARTWARVAPWARIRSERTGPPRPPPPGHPAPRRRPASPPPM